MTTSHWNAIEQIITFLISSFVGPIIVGVAVFRITHPKQKPDTIHPKKKAHTASGQVTRALRDAWMPLSLILLVNGYSLFSILRQPYDPVTKFIVVQICIAIVGLFCGVMLLCFVMTVNFIEFQSNAHFEVANRIIDAMGTKQD